MSRMRCGRCSKVGGMIKEMVIETEGEKPFSTKPLCLKCRTRMARAVRRIQKLDPSKKMEVRE